VRTCGWAESTINFNVGPRSGRFVVQPTVGVALVTGEPFLRLLIVTCTIISLKGKEQLPYSRDDRMGILSGLPN
jgi:hypothetical protein